MRIRYSTECSRPCHALRALSTNICYFSFACHLFPLRCLSPPQVRDLQHKVSVLESQLQELDEARRRAVAGERTALDWKEKWNYQVRVGGSSASG